MTNQTFESLFTNDGAAYVVPEYQRAYSWGEKQIKQWVEDVKQGGGTYYLGHFLFEKNEDSEVKNVIDGQQRLTTSILFLKALANELSSRGEEHRVVCENISHFYLKNQRTRLQRFEVVRADQNFFSDLFDQRSVRPSRKSQKLALEAFSCFCSVARSASTEEILSWYKLITKATVTTFDVSGKIEAAQIFAFQNDRGKPLSQLEVLKAYFMLQVYLLAKTKAEIKTEIGYVEDEFGKIYSTITMLETDEDIVLRYYWITAGRLGYNTEKTVDEIKEALLRTPTADRIPWIKNFMRGLTSAFEVVAWFETSRGSSALDLRYLNRMALSYPFIIKAKNVQAEDNVLDRLLRLLENITFRVLLRSGRAADIEARLNKHLGAFNDSNSLNLEINKMIQNLKTDGWWSYWSDPEMKRHLEGWFYQNRVDNYMLWKYELAIASPDYPVSHVLSFDNLISQESIEHIAPQTPTNKDPVASGYGVYEDNVNRSNGIVTGEWLNCVGNLMLISQPHNSSVGNRPFTEKLASYGQANLLHQQREISRFSTRLGETEELTWDSSAIQRRRDSIVVVAQRIWSLDAI